MFTVSFTDNPVYSVGDKPALRGVVRKDGVVIGSAELAFANMRAFDFNKINLFDEQQVTLTATDWEFIFPNIFTFQYDGQLFFIMFVLSTVVTATVNGVHTAVATTLNVTVSAGAIPEKGWVKIGSEIMEFVKLSAASLTVNRAQYQTAGVALSGGEAIVWTTTRETLIPDRGIEILDDFDKVALAR